jgi:hypothetical protein
MLWSNVPLARFLLIFAVSVAPIRAQSLLPDDRAALAEFFTKFETPLGIPTGWTTGDTSVACTWPGVSCTALNDTFLTIKTLYVHFHTESGHFLGIGNKVPKLTQTFPARFSPLGM